MTERNTGKKNRYHRYKKQKPKFEGKEESLKGYIFDYSGSKNPDQWIKTSKEIRGFVGRTATKFNKELTTAVKELELTDPNPPVRPNGTNPFDIHEYGQRFKDHQALLQVISDFRSKLYAVVMGQCTPAMEAHLRSHEDFEDAENDGIAILKMIKNILHTFEDKREPAEALLEVKEEFYGMKQGSSSLEDYYEHFKAQVEVMKMVGVDVVDPSLVVAIAKARDPRAEPSAQDRTAAYNKTLAVRFLRGSHERYHSYLRDLRNGYLRGRNEYPKTLTEAYHIISLQEYDTPIAGLDNDGVAFVNDGTTMVLTPGKDGKSYGHVECHNCGKKGHYSKQCPDVDGNDEGGESECTYGFSFAQPPSRHRISRSWILLDNQSTVDLFCNPKLLKNIRKSNDRMIVHCNAGQRTVSQVGELEGYGTVWYDPNGIANILSMRNVRQKYRVEYDSHEGPSFIVTKPDGVQFEFTESEAGLFYLDASNSTHHEFMHVNTVDDNRLRYTANDFNRAKIARNLQIRITLTQHCRLHSDRDQ